MKNLQSMIFLDQNNREAVLVGGETHLHVLNLVYNRVVKEVIEFSNLLRFDNEFSHQYLLEFRA